MFLRATKAALLAIAALPACVSLRSDTASQPPSRMDRLPRVTLWAWERSENLSPADPALFAIAYLDQTLTIGLTVQAHPRRDPIIFAANATRIPVVRIETARHALLDAETRSEAIQAILLSARSPGIGALQVDFDATRSQREWYRELIVELRREMPPQLPLSITALASWCSYDDWVRGLPVDEAVPMFFRMEPARRRAPADFADFQMREPLCRDSVGVSTGEPWPTRVLGKRIYIFSDHGWRKDLTVRFKRRVQ
ncbi:MAG TPA: DUF3142 domain-containing protein [Silvibacterium sp.]|nr:DUF3142 domain-containing protein [Silvibacterium sp.]